MQFFSIRDIENLSGIKAHTLRIWEQRYKLIIPARKESMHRLYSNEDLKQILKISYLYHRGFKISRIARMSAAEIDAHSLEYHKDSNYDVFINQFVESALDLDQERFEQVFRSLIAHLGFEQAMIRVVYPFLERLGMLWMTGNFLPAQEHFSSHLIRKQILLDTDRIKAITPSTGESIILFTPEGEHHEIPILLIANLLRKNGFRVVYFGTNLPLDTLAGYADQHPGDALYFHVLTNFTDLRPDGYVAMLRERFPARRIYVSGPVTKEITLEAPGLKILHSLKDVQMLKPGQA